MKSKKFFAYLLAATMVLGSTVTAFAGSSSSSTTGEGTGTGHLEKSDVFTADLPQSSTMFNFYVDPERLILASGEVISGGAGTAISSDAAAHVNGVYFNQGDKFTSESTGAAIQVKNYDPVKVSCSVSVTSASGFVLTGSGLYQTGSDTAIEAENAELYLGIGVATDAAISTFTPITGSTVEVEKEVAGQDDKYDVIVSGGAYVLREKTTDDWTTVYFKMQGAVTKSEVANAEAPQLAFTWKIDSVNGSSTSPWSSTDGVTITGSSSPYSFAMTKNTGKITFNSNISKIEYRNSSDGTFAEFAAGSSNVTKSGAVLTMLKSYIDGKSAGFQIRVTTTDGTYVFVK